MAERRMFSKKITESDAFLDMPASSQALYFHLSMNADDDGFVNSPKSIQRTVGASIDDMKLLLIKKFIIDFESGIIVIKHWKMHNYIQSDRYKPTDYVEEKSQLVLDDKKAYSKASDGMYTECIQSVSIGKDRIGKDRIDNNKEQLGCRQHPSVEEIEAYIKEKSYQVDAQRFFDYYESNGWKVGKNPMKDWKATIRGWHSRNASNQPKSTKKDGYLKTDYDFDELERLALEKGKGNEEKKEE